MVMERTEGVDCLNVNKQKLYISFYNVNFSRKQKKSLVSLKGILFKHKFQQYKEIKIKIIHYSNGITIMYKEATWEVGSQVNLGFFLYRVRSDIVPKKATLS